MTDSRPAPRFKVGQVVVMKSLKKQPVFRVLSVHWEDGWYYQWNRNNYAAEDMLRELAAEEKG